MKKFTSTLKENPGKLPGLKSIRTEYGFPSASITGLLQSTGATVITPSSETGFTEEHWDLEGGVARANQVHRVGRLIVDVNDYDNANERYTVTQHGKRKSQRKERLGNLC
ncbi:hypothetical protein C8F04DRAFT_1199451 [Mycena alexandri]|uniref:Uncharacterized protein n=1 Tax=Mycena alexandri TaxID=1745969 RepID=A0AAD6S0L8_9AGAR|nr:hypothetical protein C8F04DRAFT_1199451 [Mycena alexandri]